jgi:formiminotetrahydrofolate cyclodeaminase
MVARLTLKRPAYESHWPQAKEVLTESETVRNELMSLIDEDAKAFGSLMQAYKLPKESEQEKRQRSEEIQRRLKEAAEVPMKTAQRAARALTLCKELAAYGNENALSDLSTATHLAYAGTMGAIANVRINLTGIKDEGYAKELSSRVDVTLEQADKARLDALKTLVNRKTAP